MPRPPPENDVPGFVPQGHYAHAIDESGDVIVAVGPRQFQSDDEFVFGPAPLITVPENCYVLVDNPVVRDSDGKPLKQGLSFPIRFGDTEIRLQQPPFPLYPMEEVRGGVQEIPVLVAEQALHLKALKRVQVAEVMREVGDEWLFFGPGMCFPQVEVEIVGLVDPVPVQPFQALHLRATKAFVDGSVPRTLGDEWLLRGQGDDALLYFPPPTCEVVGMINPMRIAAGTGLHLKAQRALVDGSGQPRKHGEEWILTYRDTKMYIPSLDEEIVDDVSEITLEANMYCVVFDPVDKYTHRCALGTAEVREGPAEFFLLPGESAPQGVQSAFICSEDEGVLVRALATCLDDDGMMRKAGETWLIPGPVDYIPTVDVEVLGKRDAVQLQGGGVYVQNARTGKTRVVMSPQIANRIDPGNRPLDSCYEETYLLTEEEEVRTKFISAEEAALIEAGIASLAGDGHCSQDKMTWIGVPLRTVVNIYDETNGARRFVLGPNVAHLRYEEHFLPMYLPGHSVVSPPGGENEATPMDTNNTNNSSNDGDEDVADMEITHADAWPKVRSVLLPLTPMPLFMDVEVVLKDLVNVRMTLKVVCMFLEDQLETAFARNDWMGAVRSRLSSDIKERAACWMTTDIVWRGDAELQRVIVSEEEEDSRHTDEAVAAESGGWLRPTDQAGDYVVAKCITVLRLSLEKAIGMDPPSQTSMQNAYDTYSHIQDAKETAMRLRAEAAADFARMREKREAELIDARQDLLDAKARKEERLLCIAREERIQQLEAVLKKERLTDYERIGAQAPRATSQASFERAVPPDEQQRAVIEEANQARLAYLAQAMSAVADAEARGDGEAQSATD